MNSYFVTSHIFSTTQYILRTGVNSSLVWDKIPRDVAIPRDVVIHCDVVIYLYYVAYERLQLF